MTAERARDARSPWWRSRWSRANALTGLVVIGAVIVLWLGEIAAGEDGSPYGQLAALAGVTYVLAIAWLRRRS